MWALNATFLVLAQRDFGWSKADFSLHLFIVAIFTSVGALMGATRMVAKINPITKLTACAIIPAFALYSVLKFQSFLLSSLFMVICDALIVFTMAVARTKVQLIAKQFYPDFLSAVIAARSVIIKAATLLSVGTSLLMAELISLEATLTLFIIPIGLSFLPILLGASKGDTGSIHFAGTRNCQMKLAVLLG